MPTDKPPFVAGRSAVWTAFLILERIGKWQTKFTSKYKTGRRRRELMPEKDSDGGQKYHITLSSYDRSALEYMKACHGISATKAIRICIRAAAWQLGFKKPPFLNDRDE